MQATTLLQIIINIPVLQNAAKAAVSAIFISLFQELHTVREPNLNYVSFSLIDHKTLSHMIFFCSKSGQSRGLLLFAFAGFPSSHMTCSKFRNFQNNRDFLRISWGVAHDHATSVSFLLK